MTTDRNIRLPNSYDGFTSPAVGGQYRDELSGLTVTRLSDARARGVPAITVEYATCCVFSGDRILLQHNDHFALYGAAGFVRDLPLSADCQPRWSKTDPNSIYFRRGNQLRRFNLVNSSDTIIHAFTEYQGIDGMGEGDLLGDYLAFAGGDLNADGQLIPREVFNYQISANRKSAVLPLFGRGLDSLYNTPDGNVTVTWLERGAGRFNGIELFNGSMVFQRQLTRAGGHMDVGRDENGDECLFWTNSNEPEPTSAGMLNAIVKVRMRDGQHIGLLSMVNPWNLSVNVSCSARWVYVSAYGDVAPGPEWGPFTNEVLRIRPDGSGFERLAWHRSRPSHYNSQPKANAAYDDSAVAWCSNMGLPGMPAEYADVYMARLAGGSPAPPTPDPPPPPPPDPPIVITPTGEGNALVARLRAGLPPNTKLTVAEWNKVFQPHFDRPLPTARQLGFGNGQRPKFDDWLRAMRTRPIAGMFGL